MRGKSMILIVIALGCGLVASIGISQILDRNSGAAAKTETRKIYVAVRDVDIGERFDADMIKLEEWPIEKIPEGAATKLEEVKGLVPNQRLYAGEVIRNEKLVDPNKGTIDSQKIPKGYRVQAVRVKSEDVVGNLVSPGDHVDVQVYLRKGGNIPQAITKTVLEDVRVFAVNSETTRQIDEDGNKINAKTVSLLVKPNQLQTLLLAAKVGQISLSLRHPDDDVVVETTDGTRLPELLNGRAEDATVKSEKIYSGPSSDAVAAAHAANNFKRFLDDMNDKFSRPATSATADQVALHYMQIITPNGVNTYELRDTTEISQPRQVDGSSGPAGPVAPPATPAAADTFADPDGPAPSDVDDTDHADSTGGSDDSDWDPDA